MADDEKPNLHEESLFLLEEEDKVQYMHDDWQCTICEFFGTIFFGYSVCIATSVWHVGLGLFINLIFTHTISFALLNPQITTAIMILPSKLRFPVKKGLMYQGAQYCGVFVGACFAWLMADSHFYFPNGEPVDSTASNLLRIFFSELYGSAIFAMVNIVAWNQKVFKVPFFALIFIASGLALTASWCPKSGGAVNPAMALSINLAQAMIQGTSAPLEYIWVWIIADYIGAVAGVTFYQLIWRMLLKYQTHEKLN